MYEEKERVESRSESLKRALDAYIERERGREKL